MSYKMLGASILYWFFSYGILSWVQFNQQQITHLQCGMSTLWIGSW